MRDQLEQPLLVQPKKPNLTSSKKDITKAGTLSSLFSLFPVIVLISSFLTVEEDKKNDTLYSFRLSNSKMHLAAERAFLYRISLKLLTHLSNLQGLSIPLTIAFDRSEGMTGKMEIAPEFKRYIANPANIETLAKLSFQHQIIDASSELAKMQASFLKLCDLIGNYKELNENNIAKEMNCDCFKAFDLAKACGCFCWIILFPCMLTACLGGVCLNVYDKFQMLDEKYDSEMTIHTNTAKMFKIVSDTSPVNVVKPIDWFERLAAPNPTPMT